MRDNKWFAARVRAFVRANYSSAHRFTVRASPPTLRPTKVTWHTKRHTITAFWQGGPSEAEFVQVVHGELGCGALLDTRRARTNLDYALLGLTTYDLRTVSVRERAPDAFEAMGRILCQMAGQDPDGWASLLASVDGQGRFAARMAMLDELGVSALARLAGAEL